MDKMIAVVFENEKAAYKGVEALASLSAEGSIYVYAEVVVTKNADGTITTKKVDGEFPIRTFGGTAFGALIGLLGGPIGAGIGATAGAVAGIIGDVHAAEVDSDFLSDVTAALTPGRYAVVANISEEWVTPVDARMEAIGGVVFRALRQTVVEDQWDRDAATLRAEIDQLKAEHAKAAADRKNKLQTKIDSLNARREKKLEQSRLHAKQVKQELDAKVEALQRKAAKEKGDVKAALEARIANLRQEFKPHKHAKAG
jgi:uncharacterized membrane protein